MRRSLIPSLHALMAFESAARQGGVLRAARELHLSQSAVSRLVQQVESTTGVKLFDRVRQRLVLTEAGQAYARAMGKLLGELEQATLQLMAHGAGGRAATLNLGVFSTFGTKWLIPRLETFRRCHPKTIISCYARPRPFSFEEDPLDAAIHYGDPVWPDAIVDTLFEEELVPVASPEFPHIGRLRTARDILSFPLLHEVTRPLAWESWFQQQGVTVETTLLGARFDQFNMVAEAAKAGLGIALVPRFLFEAEIAAGDLVVPIDRPLTSDHKYHFVYPHRNAGNALVIAFRDWLLGVARQERRVLRCAAP